MTKQSWDRFFEKPHLRSIRTTLILLEQGMREFERMLFVAKQADHGTLYDLRIDLSDSQIDNLKIRFAEIRTILSEIKTVLALEPEKENLSHLIWSWVWSIQESVTELLPQYLRAYGELPPEINKCMEKNIPRLSEILQEIAKTTSKRAPMPGKE